MLSVRKRVHASGKRVWLVRMASLLAAAGMISIILLCMGYHPLRVFGSLIYGAFGRRIFIQETVKRMIPLLTAAMGLGLAFKMKLWNVGGEGQILMGGAAATAVAIYGEGLPHTLLLFLMGIAGIVGGGLWGLIPGACKARWNTNETLLTLMFNYIAQKFIVLLQNTPSWQDEYNAYPQVKMLSINARLPRVFGVHIGWMIVILLMVLFYIYAKKTKQGFEIEVVGDSQNTARYAGISVRSSILRTMFLSAALCGLAGFLQVSGADGTLSDSTAGGMGFTAITVAWMAGINPVGMLVVALFISTLERGSSYIQTDFLIPASFADVMVGIILLFMMGCEFFIGYEIVRRRESNAG